MPNEKMPPPLPRPKRIWAFCVILALLAAMDLTAIVTTASSQSEIIARLYPLRAVIFGICAACYGVAIWSLIQRWKVFRWIVSVGVILQISYMLLYNGLLIVRDWPPTPFMILGYIIGLCGAFVPFLFLLWFSYSRVVSSYLNY
jgi:hypothetical protein